MPMPYHDLSQFYAGGGNNLNLTREDLAGQRQYAQYQDPNSAYGMGMGMGGHGGGMGVGGLLAGGLPMLMSMFANQQQEQKPGWFRSAANTVGNVARGIGSVGKDTITSIPGVLRNRIAGRTTGEDAGAGAALADVLFDPVKRRTASFEFWRDPKDALSMMGDGWGGLAMGGLATGMAGRDAYNVGRGLYDAGSALAGNQGAWNNAATRVLRPVLGNSVANNLADSVGRNPMLGRVTNALSGNNNWLNSAARHGGRFMGGLGAFDVGMDLATRAGNVYRGDVNYMSDNQALQGAEGAGRGLLTLASANAARYAPGMLRAGARFVPGVGWAMAGLDGATAAHGLYRMGQTNDEIRNTVSAGADRTAEQFRNRASGDNADFYSDLADASQSLGQLGSRMTRGASRLFTSKGYNFNDVYRRANAEQRQHIDHLMNIMQSHDTSPEDRRRAQTALSQAFGGDAAGISMGDAVNDWNTKHNRDALDYNLFSERHQLEHDRVNDPNNFDSRNYDREAYSVQIPEKTSPSDIDYTQGVGPGNSIASTSTSSAPITPTVNVSNAQAPRVTSKKPLDPDVSQVETTKTV